MAITCAEFGALFGSDGSWTPNATAVLRSEAMPAQKEIVGSLTEAMRTTLSAEKMKAAWGRPAVRCAAALSTRMVSQSEALAAVLGQLTRSDTRRVETLYFAIVEGETMSDAHLAATAEAVRSLTQ